jgi:hypothetical protein
MVSKTRENLTSAAIIFSIFLNLQHQFALVQQPILS